MGDAFSTDSLSPTVNGTTSWMLSLSKMEREIVRPIPKYFNGAVNSSSPTCEDQLLYETCQLLIKMFVERKHMLDSVPLAGNNDDPKLATIGVFPFQRWKFSRGALMALSLTSMEHIKSLETHDEALMVTFKQKYWQTNEGRRDWFWWRMGKEDDEDLDDFLLGRPAACAYRRYRKSQLEWRDKISKIVETTWTGGKKSASNNSEIPDSALKVLGDLKLVMSLVREDFWEWNKLFRIRLDSIDWSPPRRPFNVTNIEEKMNDLENSFQTGLKFQRLV